VVVAGNKSSNALCQDLVVRLLYLRPVRGLVIVKQQAVYRNLLVCRLSDFKGLSVVRMLSIY